VKLGVKLYLSTENLTGIFGNGKWKLLNAIKQQGSMNKASVSLQRGYRKVWGDIQKAEDGFGRLLIKRQRGGASGGQSELTDFGKELLTAWDNVYKEVTIQAEKSFKKHVAPLLKKKTNDI